MFFLCAPSPGQVFRFLERHYTPSQPISLLLSSPVCPSQWRVLRPSDLLYSENSAELLPILRRAYPNLFHLTLQEKGLWEITQWQGEFTETYVGEGLGESKGIAKYVKWGRNKPLLTLTDWGKQHQMPVVSYVTRPPKKQIDYETVAVLDQRSLLVETEPLWYRFSLVPVKI